jgi:flavin reductase (DIM6/NTAB) family NADH-FMN oxidoreductase RutF
MDRMALRQVLGGFATGVCVMTTSDPDHISGHVIGITANSFSSVSLDPPLVQWCLDLKAHRYDIFAKAKVFGVNILSAGQESVSRRFSKENAHVVPEEGLISDLGPLRLKAVKGYMTCETYETRLVGDHLVIVGRVIEMDREETAPVLTFYQGKYGRIGDFV